MFLAKNRKWWLIKGLRNPVYVCLKKNNMLIGLWLIITIIGTTIGELIEFLPAGTSVLVATMVFIGNFVFYVTGHMKDSLSNSDILFLRGLLSALRDRIVYWSIPSIKIPVSSSLTGGYYLVVYFCLNKYRILVVKPKSMLRVSMCKPVVKLKWRWKKPRDDLLIGEALVVFPHPCIRGSCYHVEGRIIEASQYINPQKVSRIIDGFDKYFLRGGGHGLYTPNRRYTYTGSI